MQTVETNTRNWPRLAAAFLAVAIALHAMWWIRHELGSNEPDLGSDSMVWFELLYAVPAILCVLGLSWCRFIVAIQCILLLPFWMLMPVAQHAIERTSEFWTGWALFGIVIFSGAIASWFRPGRRVYATA